MANRKDPRGRALKSGEVYRKDGRYVYTYTNPLGQRKYIYANDLVSLRKKEQELLKAQLDGLDVYTAGNATINFVFDRYIALKQHLKDSTKSGYIYTYNHFVRKDFGKKKIADIKYSDVVQYYLYLLKDKEIALGTLDSIHCLLHPTFELAVRDDIIRKNPTTGAMKEVNRRSGKNRGIRHALTIEQQRAFMNYIANSPVYYHWWPLFTFLLGTGCRIGEAIALRWDDLDFKNKMITINHSIANYKSEEKNKCVSTLSTPKTEAGIRTIPMLDVVYDALKLEEEDQQENGFNETVIDGVSGFVFQNRFGNILNQQAVNSAIKRIVTNYNNEEEITAAREKRNPLILPYFSCHILRHTFATRLCEQETNLKVIQSIMGHRNIETTMDIYAEATDKKKKESFENLSVKLDVF
jgi:integrase